MKTHPNVRIQWVAQPNATYNATLTTECRSHSLPDVVVMLTGGAGVSLSPYFGCFKTLTPASVGSIYSTLKGWSGTARGLTTSQYFGVPLGSQGLLWYFNKTAFSKAGLDPSKPPVTWSQFLADAAKLKAAGITPIGVSGADSVEHWWAWNTLFANDFHQLGDNLKFYTGSLSLSDPRVKTELDAFVQTKAFWATDYQSLKWTDVESQFIAGKVGMVSGLLGDAMNWSEWDSKIGKTGYGVFVGPLLPSQQSRAVAYSPEVGLCVSNNSKQATLALDFIRFVTSRAGQSLMLKDGGLFPNRTDVDVSDVTESVGATRIAKLLKKFPTAPFAALHPPALGMSILGTLTPSIADGNTAGYLSTLQSLNHG